ncbi:MAG: hypothetical protein DWI58_14725 [Chloroflexi bacterium]|nr:MAG: hypothetical protein DWI58_14725 [Chloroflexota bacterium]
MDAASPPRGTGKARAVGWSPDGTLLAIVEETRLPNEGRGPEADVICRIVDVRANREVAAFAKLVGNGQDLSYIVGWSKDGSRIYARPFTFAV